MVLVISVYRTAQPLLRTFSIRNAVTAATAVIKLMFLVVWRQLCLSCPLQFVLARLSILLQSAGLCWGAPPVPLTVCVSLLFSCLIFLLLIGSPYLWLIFLWASPGPLFQVNIALPTFAVKDLENLTFLGTSWVQSSVCCLICLCGAQTPSLSMPSSPKTINRISRIVCMSVSDGCKAVMPFTLSEQDRTNQLSPSPPAQVPADFSAQSLQSPP